MPSFGSLSGATMEDALARNEPYVKPGAGAYSTPLGMLDEMMFRQWIADNKVPFNPDAQVSDYDMRGFYRGMQQQNPRAISAIDPNDGRLHYPDYWKTPYHETFSNESQWAGPMAPQWTPDDKLVSAGGRVLFDDRDQQSRDSVVGVLRSLMSRQR
jgi:hypothetical protein